MRCVCFKKLAKYLWDTHVSPVASEGMVVDSNTDGFSCFFGNLFAAMVYHLEVGDVGSDVVVRNTMFVNCTGDMPIVFFYSIFQSAIGFFYVRKVVIFV